MDRPEGPNDPIPAVSTDIGPYAGIYLGGGGLAPVYLLLSGLSQSKNVA